MTDYSRGDYADLPAGTTDLENNYTAPDLTAIASNDNSTYAEQTANNEIAIHQYKKTVTGQYTNITWSGKSSLAPSDSPVILQVYNVNGIAWEELDRDDSTAADTDFDIIYNNLATADYLDSGVITWRVWQAASAPAGGIDYRSSSASDVDNDTPGSITVPKPTGVEDGDFLFVSIGSRSTLSEQGVLTAPSGWNLIDTQYAGPNNCYIYAIYWKIASSEGASWTWTTLAQDQRDTGACIALTGVASSTPIDIIGTRVETLPGGGTPWTYSVPDVTTTADGAWLINDIIWENGSSFDNSSNYLPSGNTGRLYTNPNAYVTTFISTRSFPSHGSTGVDSFEVPEQVYYLGWKVAVKPA